MVTCPKLWRKRFRSGEWLIFEEEYYRADAPTRVSQMGFAGPT